MSTRKESEAARYFCDFIQYCHHKGLPGVGADIGSQGFRTVPWAMQLDLPPEEFSAYCGGEPAHGPIQLRGHADKLPFDSDSLDFLLSSHLLEDFLEWTPVLREWVRVLKPGGHLIILVPDKERWGQAIIKGQPPNCSHKHESFAGELSTYAEAIGVTVLEDRLTDKSPNDYSILFVGQKL